MVVDTWPTPAGHDGLKDTLVPMWLSLIGLWLVGLGGGVVLAYVSGLGATGLWWGMAAGTGLTCATATNRALPPP